MKAARGFKNFAGEHCATTALRQVFACRGIKLSEEMLLGLGEGVGFDLILPKKGGLPSIEMRGSGLLQLESNICDRLGIQMKASSSKTEKAAEKDLLKVLGKDEAAVVYVDIGRLPYAEGGWACHVNDHAVAVAGVDFDEGSYLVADTDEPFHIVSLRDLGRARSSVTTLSPVRNVLLTFNYPKTLAPIAAAIETAAGRVAERMLSVQDANTGVKGMNKFAETLLAWPDELGIKETRDALVEMAALIEKTDNGGGGFRKMYGRFLGEASRMLKDPEVASLASAVTGLARKWSTLAGKLKSLKAKDIPGQLQSIQKKMLEVAESEESAWDRQRAIFE